MANNFITPEEASKRIGIAIKKSLNVVRKINPDDIIRNDTVIGTVRLTTALVPCEDGSTQTLTRVDCIDPNTMEYVSVPSYDIPLWGRELYIDLCIPLLKAELDKSKHDSLFY